MNNLEISRMEQGLLREKLLREQIVKLKARVKELEEALRELNSEYFKRVNQIIEDHNRRHGETVEGP